MKTEWIVKDGHKRNVFNTFPYAFRYVYNLIEVSNKKTESITRTPQEIIDSVYFISPIGKVYIYPQAVKLAKSQSLIDNDGKLNSKEFKKSK